jgi:single-strand DNA-binding protein
MSHQVLIILGNVGKVDIRHTSNGTKVANFSVAVSEKRQGEEQTTWFNCLAFNKTADVVESYVTKGTKVLVQGKIQTRKYDKDGETRHVWEVITDRLSLESARTEQREDSWGGGNSGGAADDLDSEIPF